MSDSQSTDKSDGGDVEIDIREYLGVIADHWYWLVLFALTGLAIAAYQAWEEAPVFSASALMQVEKSQNMAPQGLGGEQAAAAAMAASRTTAEGAILQSRSVIAKAVEAEHLEVRVSPIYFPYIGEQIARFRSAYSRGYWTPAFVDAKYDWGNESIRVTRIELPQGHSMARFDLTVVGDDAYEIGHGDFSARGKVGKTLSVDMPALGTVRVFVQSIKAAPGTQFSVASISKEAAIASLQSRMSVSERPSGSGLLVQR